MRVFVADHPGLPLHITDDLAEYQLGPSPAKTHAKKTDGWGKPEARHLDRICGCRATNESRKRLPLILSPALDPKQHPLPQVTWL